MHLPASGRNVAYRKLAWQLPRRSAVRCVAASSLCHNLTRVLLMETTRLSTKGQIVLPKTMRTSRAWGPGTEFTVEETGDGILLRPAGVFSEANLDQVAGCL